MKQIFGDKYRDYYRARETRDKIFRSIQGENESLEDYEERFQCSYNRAYNCILDEVLLTRVFRRGIEEDFKETINLLSNGDIYPENYGAINRNFENYSRASKKKGINDKNMVNPSSTSSEITKNEIG